ncbi:hypothetical protein O3P69_005988 [Scylla paramamosain]|uniref:Chitin-binding type-2 domain-containing protein n=1 Tax=Scylla paramamosain TaxID=85552 RepID=A0AAW0U5M1_SCYPA
MERGDFLDYAYTGGRQPIKVQRQHDSDDFYDDPADLDNVEYDDYYYYYYDDSDDDDKLTKDDNRHDLDLLHDNVIHKNDNIKSKKCSCDKEEDGSEKFQVKGAAGVDFPALTSLPRTSFRCEGRELGYYADLETRCQVFHVCEPGNAQHDFLCPKGTIFNQKYIVCDWWYNVDCPRSPEFFGVNQDFFKDGKITTPPAPPPSAGTPVGTPVVPAAGRPLTHQQRRPNHRRRKQRPRPQQQAQAEPVTPQAEEYVPPLPPDAFYSRPQGVAEGGNVRSSFNSGGGPRPPTSAAGLPYVTPSRGTDTSGGSVSPIRSTVRSTGRPQQRPRDPRWQGNTRSRTRQLGGGLEVSYLVYKETVVRLPEQQQAEQSQNVQIHLHIHPDHAKLLSHSTKKPSTSHTPDILHQAASPSSSSTSTTSIPFSTTLPPPSTYRGTTPHYRSHTFPSTAITISSHPPPPLKLKSRPLAIHPLHLHSPSPHLSAPPGQREEINGLRSSTPPPPSPPLPNIPTSTSSTPTTLQKTTEDNLHSTPYTSTSSTTIHYYPPSPLTASNNRTSTCSSYSFSSSTNEIPSTFSFFSTSSTIQSQISIHNTISSPPPPLLSSSTSVSLSHLHQEVSSTYIHHKATIKYLSSTSKIHICVSSPTSWIFTTPSATFHPSTCEISTKIHFYKTWI